MGFRSIHFMFKAFVQIPISPYFIMAADTKNVYIEWKWQLGQISTWISLLIPPAVSHFISVILQLIS